MNWRVTTSLAALVFAALPAYAQTAPPSLDLKLHPQSYPVAGATAPGAYYGDIGGHSGDYDPRSATSVADDGRVHVSGSVSTSIGYAKGYGTGYSTGARLNMSKTFDSGGGLDLRLDVRNEHGFTPRRGYLYDVPRY